MGRTQRSIGIAMALVVALAGCGRKTETANTETSDSLLAANPVEPPQGDISPQTEYQNPPAGGEATPAPKPAATPRKTTPKRETPASATSATSAPVSRGVTVPAGTGVNVTVSTKISSETFQPGDSWSGTVKDNVIVGDRVVIPAGATVTGTVTGVAPAQKGSRAFLVLAVRSIDIDGESHAIAADTDSIIAGSTRARNMGAVAGGAAAGALIGRAVGGSGKGALIGGLLGGAAAGGAVAASKGYQVVIKEGTEITFNTREVEQIARR